MLLSLFETRSNIQLTKHFLQEIIQLVFDHPGHLPELPGSGPAQHGAETLKLGFDISSGSAFVLISSSVD